MSGASAKNREASNLRPTRLAEMLRRMLRIRHFEERVARLQQEGVLPGAAHLSLGQEAAVVGACMALDPGDYITGTHRSHGHPIGKGAALGPLMAELFGKRNGVCGGKGGSMHLADFAVGSLGESGIVGGLMPVAVGAALSAKMRGTGQIALCFFGDGAVNEGVFHESLNLAAVWQLPVVFLCENNAYAMFTRSSETSAVASVSERAAAYAMPGISVDGQDVEAVFQAVDQAAQRARAGKGPGLVEARTYRYCDHSEFGGMTIASYRGDDEVAEWRARDPIDLLCGAAISGGALTQEDIDRLHAEVLAEVDASVAFAREGSDPDAAALFEDVFA